LILSEKSAKYLTEWHGRNMTPLGVTRQKMTTADRIMKRARAHGRGTRVYSPKDFLDLGSRAAIDKALSRLVAAGTLRRVSRGLYDWPQHSTMLNRSVPPNINAVVDAVQRRANVRALPGNLAAANALGLTNAVPTRAEFLVSRKVSNIAVGNRVVSFKTAGAVLTPWLDSAAAPVVQALVWLHDSKNIPFDDAIPTLRKRAPQDAKQALAKSINRLPGWAIPAARRIVENHVM
jgi:Family of unknown function (DUF6088)